MDEILTLALRLELVTIWTVMAWHSQGKSGDAILAELTERVREGRKAAHGA